MAGREYWILRWKDDGQVATCANPSGLRHWSDNRREAYQFSTREDAERGAKPYQIRRTLIALVHVKARAKAAPFDVPGAMRRMAETYEKLSRFPLGELSVYLEYKAGSYTLISGSTRITKPTAEECFTEADKSIADGLRAREEADAKSLETTRALRAQLGV